MAEHLLIQKTKILNDKLRFLKNVRKHLTINILLKKKKNKGEKGRLK